MSFRSFSIRSTPLNVSHRLRNSSNLIPSDFNARRRFDPDTSQCAVQISSIPSARTNSSAVSSMMGRRHLTGQRISSLKRFPNSVLPSASTGTLSRSLKSNTTPFCTKADWRKNVDTKSKAVRTRSKKPFVILGAAK